jgi:rod shape-determining protein MreC
MESVLGRYRNLTILVGVLFLQVLGLAVQVKRSSDVASTRLIRVWAVGAITPFERGLVWVQNGGRSLWHDYFFLRGVRTENRELKEKIEKMTLDEVRLSEDATQAHRLQSLLAFKEQFIAKTVAAQVIGSSGSDLSRSIYIDKGDNAGLKPDMAVITAGGIVGKVWLVYPSTSLVLMINDQSSGVGVFMEKSRLQGVLRGTPNGELVLERVMSDETVTPGETVLSSGGDQIFPKGLPVGTVSSVGPGREMFLSIKVKPAADLSRLEEVLVVTEKQEREVVAEGGRARAADILARRLPSVPEKPATVEGASATGGAAGAAAGKPATGAATKLAGGTTPAASNGAAAGQPGGGEVVKKVAPKAAVAGDSAPKSATGNPPGNSTGNSSAASNATSNPAASVNPNVTPKAANSAAKPVTGQAKPSNQPSAQPSSQQPDAQPAASEENPH